MSRKSQSDYNADDPIVKLKMMLAVLFWVVVAVGVVAYLVYRSHLRSSYNDYATEKLIKIVEEPESGDVKFAMEVLLERDDPEILKLFRQQLIDQKGDIVRITKYLIDHSETDILEPTLNAFAGSILWPDERDSPFLEDWWKYNPELDSRSPASLDDGVALSVLFSLESKQPEKYSSILRQKIQDMTLVGVNRVPGFDSSYMKRCQRRYECAFMLACSSKFRTTRRQEEVAFSRSGNRFEKYFKPFDPFKTNSDKDITRLTKDWSDSIECNNVLILDAFGKLSSFQYFLPDAIRAKTPEQVEFIMFPVATQARSYSVYEDGTDVLYNGHKFLLCDIRDREHPVYYSHPRKAMGTAPVSIRGRLGSAPHETGNAMNCVFFSVHMEIAYGIIQAKEQKEELVKQEELAKKEKEQKKREKAARIEKAKARALVNRPPVIQIKEPWSEKHGAGKRWFISVLADDPDGEDFRSEYRFNDKHPWFSIVSSKDRGILMPAYGGTGPLIFEVKARDKRGLVTYKRLAWAIEGERTNVELVPIDPTTVKTPDQLRAMQEKIEESIKKTLSEKSVFDAHASAVNSLDFFRNTGLLISTGHDSKVTSWDTLSSRQINAISIDKGPITAAAFSSDSNVVVVGAGSKRSTRIVSLSPVSGISMGERKASREVKAIQFSKTGSLFAVGGTRSFVELCSSPDGAVLGLLKGHKGNVNAFLFTGDGNTLIAVGGNGLGKGVLTVWSVKDFVLQKSVAATNPSSQKRRAKRTKAVTSKTIGEAEILCAVPVGQGDLLALGTRDGKIQFWDAVSNLQMPKVLKGHDEAVVGVFFDKLHNVLISGSVDGSIRVWNIETEEMLGDYPTTESPIRSMAYTQGENTLATGHENGRIHLWDMRAVFK